MNYRLFNILEKENPNSESNYQVLPRRLALTACLVNYAQTIRGPGQQKGTHSGVLDLHGMAKIASGVLTLRLGKSSYWTASIDNGLKLWARQQIKWLTTNPLALAEKAATKYVQHLALCL